MRTLSLEEIESINGGMSNECAGAVATGLVSMLDGLVLGPAGLAAGTIVFGIGVLVAC